MLGPAHPRRRSPPTGLGPPWTLRASLLYRPCTWDASGCWSQQHLSSPVGASRHRGDDRAQKRRGRPCPGPGLSQYQWGSGVRGQGRALSGSREV